MYRLYRDSTCYDIDTGKHVKDLSLLNRDLARTILIDHSQQLPQQVQLTIPEWEGDPNDSYLLDLIPFLETLAVSGTPDVRGVLQSYAGKDVPNVFAENMARVQKHQRDLFDQRKATNSWSRFFGSFFSLSPNVSLVIFEIESNIDSQSGTARAYSARRVCSDASPSTSTVHAGARIAQTESGSGGAEDGGRAEENVG